MPTAAQKKWCKLGPDWFKPARDNNGVNELYIQNDVYGFNFIAAWPVDDKQVKQCLKFHKYRGRKVGPMGAAKIIFANGKIPHFLFFKENNLKSIVHECMHLVGYEMNRVGIKPGDVAGDEAWAYMMEWAVDTLFKQMKPKS